MNQTLYILVFKNEPLIKVGLTIEAYTRSLIYRVAQPEEKGLRLETFQPGHVIRSGEEINKTAITTPQGGSSLFQEPGSSPL